jgi:hypothetical protein
VPPNASRSCRHEMDARYAARWRYESVDMMGMLEMFVPTATRRAVWAIDADLELTSSSGASAPRWDVMPVPATPGAKGSRGVQAMKARGLAVSLPPAEPPACMNPPKRGTSALELHFPPEAPMPKEVKISFGSRPTVNPTAL